MGGGERGGGQGLQPGCATRTNNKTVKPYMFFQSQGHVKHIVTEHAFCWPSCRDVSLLGGYSTKLLSLVVWRLSSAMMSSWHDTHRSPEREMKSSEDGVRLPKCRGHSKRSYTQSSHHMDGTCNCICVCGCGFTYWMTLRADKRYNNNILYILCVTVDN